MPRCSAIFAPSSGLERPLNSISRLCGARSIQVACGESLTAGALPGTVANSGIADSTLTALSASISFDVGLLGTGNSQRVGRDVVGDDGAGARPGTVTDRDRGDEDIMRAGVDVPADGGALLLDAVVVGGDGTRADVAAGADLGVPDVGQVRHLRALPDHRVLDLNVGARLGAVHQGRSRAKVAERADQGISPDGGVDRDGVRSTCAPAPTRVAPRSTVNGCTVASASISTPGSMNVLAGSTMVTPASMWPRLIRARSSASASARSTRVLTPLATSGLPWRWACTTSPSAARIATMSVRYSSPWSFWSVTRSSADHSRSLRTT